jgi:hypothetical protein
MRSRTGSSLANEPDRTGPEFPIADALMCSTRPLGHHRDGASEVIERLRPALRVWRDELGRENAKTFDVEVAGYER